VKPYTFSLLYLVTKAAAFLTGMRRKESGATTQSRPDDEEQCRVIPFLQHETWWQTAEWLASLFRKTQAERHRRALRRHLDAVYARLTEGSAS
jgi:hypothetical protein